MDGHFPWAVARSPPDGQTSAQDVIEGKSDIGKGYDDAISSKAKEIKGPDIPEGKFQFPLKGRLDSGNAEDLTKSKYDEVKPDHQWEKAEAPAKPSDNKSNDHLLVKPLKNLLFFEFIAIAPKS